MADRVARGQIWLLDLPRPDKRRPVLVLSRPSLLRVLHTATVVAITRTLRGAPTEVELGTDTGLKEPSCASLCNLFTVPQHRLTTFVGTVSAAKMTEVCRSLAIACACETRAPATG